MGKSTEVRTGSLDFLKIVATILIVFHHYQQITGLTFNRLNFYNGTFSFSLVVEFFFLLSGFFMFRYVRRIKKGLSFKEFFLKRVVRLLPLVLISAIAYELLLCVYRAVFHQNYWGISINIWGIIIDALGVQAGWSFGNPCVNNPTWYISVLILCYVVFYFSTWMCKKLKVSPTYAYIFIILLGCGIMSYGIDLPFLNYSAARGYYSFFFGILLAKLLNKRTIKLKHCLISAATAIFTIWLIVGRFSWMVPTGDNYLMTFVAFPAIIIFFLYRPIAKLFDHKAISFLGAATYDVYIWHSCGYIVMYLLAGTLTPSLNILCLPAMLVFTVSQFIVGVGSYLLVEQPINKAIRKRLEL